MNALKEAFAKYRDTAPEGHNVLLGIRGVGLVWVTSLDNVTFEMSQVRIRGPHSFVPGSSWSEPSQWCRTGLLVPVIWGYALAAGPGVPLAPNWFELSERERAEIIESFGGSFAEGCTLTQRAAHVLDAPVGFDPGLALDTMKLALVTAFVAPYQGSDWEDRIKRTAQKVNQLLAYEANKPVGIKYSGLVSGTGRFSSGTMQLLKTALEAAESRLKDKSQADGVRDHVLVSTDFGPLEARAAAMMGGYPAEGYERLHAVYRDAHDQAAYGKGNERHANDLPFHEQRMQTISQGLNSPDGMAYQVIKKLQEGLQMKDPGARRRELLGALNYLAGVVIFLDDQQEGGGA